MMFRQAAALSSSPHCELALNLLVARSNGLLSSLFPSCISGRKYPITEHRIHVTCMTYSRWKLLSTVFYLKLSCLKRVVAGADVCALTHTCIQTIHGLDNSVSCFRSDLSAWFPSHLNLAPELVWHPMNCLIVIYISACLICSCFATHFNTAF